VCPPHARTGLSGWVHPRRMGRSRAGPIMAQIGQVPPARPLTRGQRGMGAELPRRARHGHARGPRRRRARKPQSPHPKGAVRAGDAGQAQIGVPAARTPSAPTAACGFARCRRTVISRRPSRPGAGLSPARLPEPRACQRGPILAGIDHGGHIARPAPSDRRRCARPSSLLVKTATRLPTGLRPSGWHRRAARLPA
jgi:hypothetical protein